MALSADSTTNVIREVENLRTIAMPVKNSSVIYNFSLLSLDTTEGEVKAFDGTQADKVIGWHFGDSVTGNSSAPRNMAIVKPGGFILRNHAVTGLLNTSADYGAKVYATDDATYTVVDPGSGRELGTIVPDANTDTGKASILFRNLLSEITS